MWEGTGKGRCGRGEVGELNKFEWYQGLLMVQRY